MKSRRLLALASTARPHGCHRSAGRSASAQWNSQPSIVGSNKVNVMKGGESWVSVNWTAPSDMENFRVIVNEWTNGVEIEYAADRTSAALTNDANLSAGEIDSTAFLLKVDENAISAHPSSSSSSPSGSTTDDLPLLPRWSRRAAEKFDGDRFSVLTDSATVKAGPAGTADPSGNWVEIDLLGLAPVTDGIKIELETDLEPYYPQETFTSLHHDDRLHARRAMWPLDRFDPELVEIVPMRSRCRSPGSTAIPTARTPRPRPRPSPSP
ncbi:MAG: hypothetical protein R2710_15155 [Acidimicrobiales bacterium]